MKLKRYTVTYNNLPARCTLHGECTKTLFADDIEEVKQLCEDLYKTTEHFRLINIKAA